MVTSAYTQYKQNNTPGTSTTLGDMTQYMNYVALDSSSMLDDHVGVNGAYQCGAVGVVCLKMPSGGTLFYMDYGHFPWNKCK